MAYQGSAQSIGFRNRTVLDPSRRMRQETQELERQEQKRIQGMEKQASQQIREMKRVSDLQASNQQYELKALAKFSNSINNVLQDQYLEMEKARKEEGIARGIQLRAENPGVRLQENAEVEEAMAKNRELHGRIEAEAQKAPTSEAAERVRSMSTYEKMGWHIGGLTQAAGGWDAHLEAELQNNETTLTDANGNEFQLNKYEGMEQYDMAVGYLQSEYIKNNNPSGLSAKVVNKYLTDKVLTATQLHRRERQRGYNVENAEMQLDGQENLLHVQLTTSDNVDEIAESFGVWLGSAHTHLDTLGDKKGVGRRMARLQLRQQIDTAIQQNPERAEMIIEALKKYQLTTPAGTKTLIEHYNDEFSPASIRAKAMEADVADYKLRTKADEVKASEAKAAIEEAYRRPDTTASDRYKLAAEFYRNHPDQRQMVLDLLAWEPVTQAKSDSQDRILELKSEYGVSDGKDGITIPLSAVEGLNPDVIAEGMEQGIIASEPFADADSVEYANKEIERAIAEVSKENSKLGINTVSTARAQEAAQKEVVKRARQIQQMAREQGRTMSDQQAVREAGRYIAEGILTHNRTNGAEATEFSQYYFKSGEGFKQFDQRSQVNAQLANLNRQNTILKDARIAKAQGQNLLTTNLNLSVSDLSPTAGGYPSPFIRNLAAEQGVTPWEMLNAQRNLNGMDPLEPPREAVMLQSTLDKFPRIKRMLSQNPTPRNIERAQREMGLISAAGMRRALGMQESSNDYNAYNKTSYGKENPALGKYQILWENVKAWTKAAGYPTPRTQNEFLNDHALQERLADWQLNQYIKQAYQKTNDPNVVIRMVAAAWYGGGGRMDDYDNPEILGTNSYDPNMQQYTTSVMNRY